MRKIRIFVYGTLKRGFYNHYLIENEKFLGEHCVYGYTLYEVPGFAYPFMVKSDGGFVKGEVWEVAMDVFEIIRRMEESAGYRVKSIGKNLFAFVFPKSQLPENAVVIGCEWHRTDWEVKGS